MMFCLFAEDSLSCIVGALLRDGIAFEIHERRVSTLRVQAPAEGMRAATLILRIPGSAFIVVTVGGPTRTFTLTVP